MRPPSRTLPFQTLTAPEGSRIRNSPRQAALRARWTAGVLGGSACPQIPSDGWDLLGTVPGSRPACVSNDYFFSLDHAALWSFGVIEREQWGWGVQRAPIVRPRPCCPFKLKVKGKLNNQPLRGAASGDAPVPQTRRKWGEGVSE